MREIRFACIWYVHVQTIQLLQHIKAFRTRHRPCVHIEPCLPPRLLFNMPAQQARNWIFTINNPVSEPVLVESMRYLLYGREVSPSGTPHLQGYVQFVNKMVLSRVKLVLGSTAHCEIARGSVLECTVYAKKDGDFSEFGESKLGANESRKRKREEVCAEIVVGHQKKLPIIDMIVANPHYARDIKELQIVRHPKRLESEKPRVLYLHGSTGSGKTTSTRNVCLRSGMDYYVKSSGHRWWSSYDQQKVVLLEEFTSCFTVSSFLQLCDGGEYRVEFKCGNTEFNSPFIIICSNRAPEEQYSQVLLEKPTTHAAYMRRVANTYCTTGRTHDQIERVVELFLDV